MRFVKTMFIALSLALVTSARAAASAVQNPGIKVDVHTDASDTTWYTSPAALIIGGLVLLLIILLTVMASRRKRVTTVIR